MSTNLVIVESPNKIKKVQSYLGNTYDVTASMGHIKGISKDSFGGLGIDIDNNFEPIYVVTPDKRKVVRDLKRKVGSNTTLWLATDYDREGEAIAVHLAEELKVPPHKQKRILFTEITKKALLASIEKATSIDMNMYHSQQARAVLDKLIGYKISPLLWENFKNYTLSAGRVQSVVVKIVLEREQEINNFDSTSYFKLTGGFNTSDNDSKKRIDKLKKPYTQAKLDINTDINTESENKIEDHAIIEGFNSMIKDKNIHFEINSLKKNKTKRKPQAPYITSTLQQDASNKLGMSPDTCMKCAQKLYEAGYITYMRTDSLMLSNDALQDIKKFVVDNYGDKYYNFTKYTKKSKNAQEAHEACRPTKASVQDVYGRDGITSQQNRLYKMIWTRTIASQMSPAELEIKTVKINPVIDDDSLCDNISKKVTKEKKNNINKQIELLNSEIGKEKEKEIKKKTEELKKCKTKKSDVKNIIESITFIGKHEKILFDGFLKASGYGSVEKDDDNEDENDEDETVGRKLVKSEKSKKLEALFDKLKEGDIVSCFYMNSEEKYTKPPHARYTEASLVKKLDELGIGRPSTYASMIKKVQDRKYVVKDSKDPEEKDISTYGFTYGADDIILETKKIKIGGDKNKMFPTSLGDVITKFLMKEFVDIMDYKFTADVESMLDEIANGNKIWYNVVQAVYDKFYPIVDRLGTNVRTKGSNETIIGINPNTENEIKVISTRLGLAICEKSDTGVIKYASLRFPISSITLENAMLALKFPAILGNYSGHPIELCFKDEYYLKYNGKYISISAYNIRMRDDPLNKVKVTELVKKNSTTSDVENFDPCKCISLEDAIKLVQDNNQLHRLERKINEDIEIKHSKFGYYFRYKGMNIGIPYKYKKDPSLIAEFTETDCLEIITAQINKKNGIIVSGESKTKSKVNKKNAKTEPINKGMIKDVKRPKDKGLNSNTTPPSKIIDIDSILAPKSKAKSKPKAKPKKEKTDKTQKDTNKAKKNNKSKNKVDKNK